MRGGKGPDKPERKADGPGREAWYFLAGLFGLAGIVVAVVGVKPEIGIVALVLSSLCFAVGILLHSVPEQAGGSDD